jgi:CRP-like cAMP-binding protein
MPEPFMSSGPPITAIERSRGGARLNNTANRLLAALPSSILNLIELHFTAVTFVAGTIVHQAGDEIDHLYFPSAGFASLQIVSRDGRLVDTALVGPESAMGPVAGVGRYKSKVRWVVRSTLAAVKISGIEFRRVAAQHSALNALCIDYNDSLLSQTQMHAVRYALLSVDARLAACLLDVSSLLASDSIPLTQEVLGEMLAVRRTSVSEAGSKLKAAGVISYSRGAIQILNRAGLLKLSRAITE